MKKNSREFSRNENLAGLCYAFDKMFSGSGDIFIFKVPSIPANYTTILLLQDVFRLFPPAQLFPHIVFNLLLKYPILIPFGSLVSPFIWLFRKSKLSQGGPLAVAWHLSPRLHLTRLWVQLWKLKPTSSSSSSSYSTSSSSPSSPSSLLFRPRLSFQREIRLLIACTTACWRAAIAESLTFYFLFEDTLGSPNVSFR